MDVQGQIERLFTALDAGMRIEDIMRRDEQIRGRRVVKPGDEPWLPLEDWDPTIVVSVDGLRVRLIAILARRPGNGAFRRLVAAITEHGLIPCVVAPTNEMRSTLKRWGWRERHSGQGWDHEEYWYPRRSMLNLNK